ALADARRVRLGDADDRVDLRRPDARALTRARRDRRRRRHVRIRAVIEIEQAALRAFEQHVLARRDRVRDVTPGIAGVAAQALAGAGGIAHPRIDLARARPRAAEVLDDGREIVDVALDELFEPIRAQQIAHPHAAAAGFHLVRRADAASRGADRFAALGAVILAQAVDELV